MARAPQRNIIIKEDPGEVVPVKWLISCFDLHPVTVFFNFFLTLFSPSVTTDASNIHGVVKASSSVELGSLYRQIEVSAFVTIGFGTCLSEISVNNLVITEAHMNNKLHISV